jgi:outer membrane protein OmpA-like peptidoglycan-associated protein
MKRATFPLIVSLILIFLSMKIFSQDTIVFQNEKFAIHPKAGIVLNFHSANFRNFENSIDCGVFKSGFGIGYSASIFGEIPVGNKIQLGLGLGIIGRSGLLKLTDNKLAYNEFTLDTLRVNFENLFDARLSYLEIQPEIRYVLIPKLISGPLRAVGALRFGFAIKKTFDQKEQIVSPDNAVFIYNNTKSRQRDIASGDIYHAIFPLFGISIGLENMLKISKKNFLTQQILFDYNLFNVVKDVEWKIFAIRFELGLRYSFERKPEEPKIEEPVKEKVPEEIAFKEKTEDTRQKTQDSSQNSEGRRQNIIDSIGKTEEVIEKKIEKKVIPYLGVKIVDENLEILTGNELLASLPLVNAVFFPVNSDVIPDYYVAQPGIEPSDRDKNAIDIHKFVMPRIVEIMRKNPKSSIILEGASAGTENEPEGVELAKRRAIAVKKAFLDLGIPESKISLKPQLRPTFISNQDWKEGIIENQRVSIILKNAPLQEYVNIQKYAELNGDIKVKPIYKDFPENQVAQLASSISDDKLTCSQPGKYTFNVKHRIENDTATIEYNSTIQSDTLFNQDVKSLDLSKLPKRQVELNLNNFEAILRFNYDRSELTDDNKGLLKQLVQLLPEGCIISIFGSSDALGTEKRNIQLEKDRASVTENYIKSISGSKFKVEISPGWKKYPEETQQGRFLNRCIRIKLRKG